MEPCRSHLWWREARSLWIEADAETVETLRQLSKVLIVGELKDQPGVYYVAVPPPVKTTYVSDNGHGVVTLKGGSLLR